ncbi:hypothetical protein [Glaciihabitans sp. dw_435]|uniref:hypothetical protein n=1 Tax=Glaciihabitans sp. dw_435 TaxID=2720081 RepID=UPI001BD3AC49|nr:hypothetical protein [Glaciihabitans sp. dw_435]
MPALNPHWIEELSILANSPGGLQVSSIAPAGVFGYIGALHASQQAQNPATFRAAEAQPESELAPLRVAS